MIDSTEVREWVVSVIDQAITKPQFYSDNALEVEVVLRNFFSVLSCIDDIPKKLNSCYDKVRRGRMEPYEKFGAWHRQHDPQASEQVIIERVCDEFFEIAKNYGIYHLDMTRQKLLAKKPVNEPTPDADSGADEQ